MKLKQIIATVFISAITAFGIIWGYSILHKNGESYAGQSLSTLPTNYKYANYGDGTLPPGTPVDFTAASEASIPTVVHIKTKINARQVTNNTPRQRSSDPFSDLFGGDMFDQLFGGGGSTREQRASGSGVIISEDGYIVTNNHVIDKADEIMITLSNKKSYKAKLVGSDPAYDLAVIKIDAQALPYLVYGNSDDVKIGQWALAIGYPLNLETTVTAGIISAKARTLGLNKDRSGNSNGAVESYLQTDAAVNPGNSGGALVNTDGRLIGINSAIASGTGYYSGYSYAIPVNIVKKVVNDIIKYGTVQRGYLGVAYVSPYDLSADERKAAGIPANAYGIYVQDVPKDGGAFESGIRKGDIIKSISGVGVSTGSELNEILSRFKPGDKVPIVYVRNGTDTEVMVSLKNSSGTYDIVKPQTVVQKLGADFLTLDTKTAKDYGVDGGVILKRLSPNGLMAQQTNIRENFVILRINNKAVKSVDDLMTAIANQKSLKFTGFFPGYDGLYDYQVDLSQ